MIFRQCGSKQLLSSTIGGTVVLCLGRKPKATEYSQPVRIERQKPGLSCNHKDLVGTRLPDHRELGQSTTSLRRGETKRRAEVAIPTGSCRGGRRQLQRSLGGWRERTGSSNLTLVMRPRGPTAQQAWRDVQSTAQ